LNRTPEESLALLLWELKQLPGDFLSGLLSRRKAMFSRYADTQKLRELLDGKSGHFRETAVRASRLSGAELDAVDTADSGPLQSVFSRLRVDGDAVKPVYYAPAPAALDNVFPETEASFDPVPLLRAFEEELRRLDASGPAGFDEWLTLLDTICKKYFWSFPACSGRNVDISLYDRMKVTAAVGICLLEAGQDADKPYLLMASDFSGIQNYIFSVSRTGVKGVSKRLRARSFLVDVMVQSLAYRLCERLELPQSSIMMMTGGKFYLLLPNLPDAARRLDEIRDETDRWLYRKFRGDIFVNMAWIPFGDEGLLHYSETITELSARLRKNKQTPFRAALLDENGWKTDDFFLYDTLDGKTACPSCARRLMRQGEEVCPECRMQEELGGRLASAETLWFSAEGQYPLWDFCGVSFDRSAAQGRLIRVEQLNRWTLDKSLLDTPLGVRLMANHLPREGAEPLTFSDIAERATGTKRIAVLKADVDNLGYLFADGMREANRHYGTISRVSALSRLLDMFFSGYVGSLLRGKYGNVYSVFAGGDDLFLIGPWDVMPELALVIHDAFTRLSGGNPCVTLSAAVCAADPKTNVALLAEHSEDTLHAVKTSAPKEIYPHKSGRDGVAFLSDSFSWEDFATQMKRACALESVSGSVDISILRRIAMYSGMYRRFLRSHDVMSLMFEPLFHYDKTRNYGKIKDDKAAPFLNWAETLKRDASQAANYRKVSRDLWFAETVVKWHLNKTKEGRKHGVSE